MLIKQGSALPSHFPRLGDKLFRNIQLFSFPSSPSPKSFLLNFFASTAKEVIAKKGSFKTIQPFQVIPSSFGVSGEEPPRFSRAHLSLLWGTPRSVTLILRNSRRGTPGGDEEQRADVLWRRKIKALASK